MITWSAPPPASTTSNTGLPTGPGALPIRSGLLVYLQPRQRLVLNYDPLTESLLAPRNLEATIVSDDHLRAHDPGLAAYPFQGLDRWKRLTGAIGSATVRGVLGEEGKVDGMTSVYGDTEEEGPAGSVSSDIGAGAQHDQQMRFVSFNLRRSWRDGAVGEEVTRYARDKSWLLESIIDRLGGGELFGLLSRYSSCL